MKISVKQISCNKKCANYASSASPKPFLAVAHLLCSQKSVSEVGMIDGITKNIAALTLVAVTYAAAFNIGYFGAFGLHFIGVMDATNFVYSFAFLFVFIVAAVSTGLPIANRFLPGPEFWRASVNVARAFGFAAIIFAFGYIVFIHSEFGILALIMAYVVGVLAGAAPIFGYWRQTRELKIQWLVVLLVLSLAALSLVGRAFGEQQKLSSRHYTFATKSGNIVGAAMLRASSSGFLIAVDGRVEFLAAPEVKSVKEER